MMDCRQAKQLLPLWVGQDLPDTVSAADVARHLERCPECEIQRAELQSSLDVLQSSSAETLAVESARHSIWPQLVSRISDWENVRRQERFNGWIPASVMALAVALMIAVSIPSIQQEFFGGNASSASMADLFDSDSEINFDRPLEIADPLRQPAIGTPVIYKR